MSEDSQKRIEAGVCFLPCITKAKFCWRGLILIVGYPVAAVLLLFSVRLSVKTYLANISGVEGRQLALEWGESVLVAFLLAMVIRSFFFQPFKIPSGSMRMTLIEGDRLFVNKLAYGPLFPFSKFRLPGFVKPRRGDVIVFRFPVTKDKDYIKRLIAFPGETVEIRDGRVFVDDQLIDDGKISRIYYYNRGDYGAKGGKIVVPAGNYFVMGDNSGSSYDSRYWGFVPVNVVIGRADVIFWPPNRVNWIK